MRFLETLHWSDGLFLQPHHFQYNDAVRSANDRLGRSLVFHYPWGIIDFELDMEALGASRVVVRRFSAIMPDGLEISSPGNCVLKPLDLSAALAQNPPELLISIAAPLWSEFEGNVAAETRPEEKKIYRVGSKDLRDENEGDNEISIVTRRINTRLTSNLDDTKDMQLLPIMRLKVLMHEGADAKISIDHSFVPPFMILSADSPVSDLCAGLLADVRRCRDKLLGSLTATAFRPQHFSGVQAHNLLVYKALNLYETRLSCFLDAEVAPCEMYTELLSFLAELMGLFPIHSIRELQKYKHADCGPQFNETIAYIRSFIQAEGGASYARHPFAEIRDDSSGGGAVYLSADLPKDDCQELDEAYIAVQSAAKELDIIAYLEEGDKFKITGAVSKSERARGIRLIAVRYPPRILPVITGALWFKLDIDSNPKLWEEICSGGAIIIDYAKNLFPALETALFITISEDKKS
jgi:type VI secretion system ImpJ/VasE family protein